MLHITKFTHTINGCCAPNAGLQLSCPRCMASLSEPNICCTSASKPGGGKRGRLGGSLQSHLKYCSCKPELPDDAQLQPAQLLLQGGKNNTLVVWAGSNSNHKTGGPTRYVFLVQLDQEMTRKTKDKVKYVSPTWRASCIDM